LKVIIIHDRRSPSMIMAMTLCPQQSTRILLPIEMEVAAGGARCEYRERRRHGRMSA